MPRGDKSSYSDKNQAKYIEDSARSTKTSKRIACVTVNKECGGVTKNKKQKSK